VADSRASLYLSGSGQAISSTFGKNGESKAAKVFGIYANGKKQIKVI
jgi:hypothetical protein